MYGHGKNLKKWIEWLRGPIRFRPVKTTGERGGGTLAVSRGLSLMPRHDGMPAALAGEGRWPTGINRNSPARTSSSRKIATAIASSKIGRASGRERVCQYV